MPQDNRKRRKELKRRDRKASRFARKIRQVEKWPEFTFEGPSNKDSGFEQLIRQAVQEFTFKSECFTEFETQFYKQWGNHGVFDAMRWAGSTLKGKCDRPDAEVGRIALLAIGERVFAIAGSPLEQYLKTHFVSFNPVGTRVVCSFSSLKRCRLPDDYARGCYDRKDGDSLYYSDFIPRCEIDGETRVVGYSCHALERLTERLVPEWKTYWGNSLLSSFMNGGIRYARGVIPNHEWINKPCLSVFRRIQPPDEFGHNDLFYPTASSLLSDDKGVGMFLRMGYCSLCLDGPLALISTFLPVGFSKTPETSMLKNHPEIRSHFTCEERKRLIDMMQSEEGRDMEFPLFPYLSAAIHLSGIPQFVLGDYPEFIPCVPASLS